MKSVETEMALEQNGEAGAPGVSNVIPSVSNAGNPQDVAPAMAGPHAAPSRKDIHDSTQPSTFTSTLSATASHCDTTAADA
jgi:hypothetical protein